MRKQEPNLRERALFLFAPERANRVYAERMRRERLNGEKAAEERGKTRMAATGYGNHGASTTLNSMIGWLAGGGSARATFSRAADWREADRRR